MRDKRMDVLAGTLVFIIIIMALLSVFESMRLMLVEILKKEVDN